MGRWLSSVWLALLKNRHTRAVDVRFLEQVCGALFPFKNYLYQCR
jgi:hypothetical protein